jgi:hypothetical protein
MDVFQTFSSCFVDFDMIIVCETLARFSCKRYAHRISGYVETVSGQKAVYLIFPLGLLTPPVVAMHVIED